MQQRLDFNNFYAFNPEFDKNVNSICAYSMIQSKSLEGAAAKVPAALSVMQAVYIKRSIKMKEKIYTIPVNDAFDKRL